MSEHAILYTGNPFGCCLRSHGAGTYQVLLIPPVVVSNSHCVNVMWICDVMRIENIKHSNAMLRTPCPHLEQSQWFSIIVGICDPWYHVSTDLFASYLLHCIGSYNAVSLLDTKRIDLMIQHHVRVQRKEKYSLRNKTIYAMMAEYMNNELGCALTWRGRCLTERGRYDWSCESKYRQNYTNTIYILLSKKVFGDYTFTICGIFAVFIQTFFMSNSSTFLIGYFVGNMWLLYRFIQTQ